MRCSQCKNESEITATPDTAGHRRLKLFTIHSTCCASRPRTFLQNHAMRHTLKTIAILLVATVANFRNADALVSRFLTMKTIIVPRGVPVTFDFTAVAGSKGMEWGTVVETFPATMGKVMMTCIASFPLGCVVEETKDGSEIVIAEVTEGLGGSNAGLLKGDRIRAFTAVTLPKKV